jgi:hypothetical protein
VSETTANRGYHYPDPTDAPNAPVQIQQLAEDVDGDIMALATVLGPVTSGVVSPAAGVTIANQQFTKSWGWITWRVAFTWGGSTIAAGSSGNIGNTTMFTITDSRFKPLVGLTHPAQGSDTGPLAQWVVSSAGLVQLCALPPNYSLTAGSTLSVAGMMRANTP